jgi:hypothetical protein
MPDLSTYAAVDAELAETAGYDVERDVSQAKRRVAALRRKLDFASSSMEAGRELSFQQQIIQEQLNQALAFIRANEDVSDADRLRNPDVVHADFSGFGQYGRC